MQLDGEFDETAIRAALEHANLNVLRVALYQLTGDESLARMRVDRTPIRGGAFFGYVLGPEFHDEVKEKAVAYLRSFDGEVPAAPGEDETRRLMELLTGDPLSDTEFRFGLEEVAFAEFPREACWSDDAHKPEIPEGYEVLIVGAGASGIVAAIQLQRLGIPYRVIERQASIGGTWELNHYPDARVDTNSYLYQFKFVKNYPWSEFFASQAEVKTYLTHVATSYGVLEHIEFGVELRTATFDEATGRWDLEFERDGEVSTGSTPVLISAAGLFSTPKVPDIPGIEDFTGRLFHTTGWDDDYDFTGERLAIIGNGSTGVQLMPRLAKDAGHLTVFQRTPQWISKMEGYKEPVPVGAQWLFDHVPYYWNWYCYTSQLTTSGMQGAQEYDRAWQEQGGQISERNDGLRANLLEYIEGKLGDHPELKAQVTPDYAPLARRLVVDNGWYDALLRDNVDLVSSGIARITPTGIVDNDGVEHEVDTIALAAGFEVAKYMWPVQYTGRGGVTLEDLWEKDGARAYLGMTIPGFPNLFIFYGPNAQPRAGGFLSWIEIWSRYVAQSIVLMLENGYRSMEARKDVHDEYNDRMDARMPELIWEREGPRTTSNYYVNQHGRQGVQMPWRLDEYHAWVITPDPSDYDLEK